MRKSKTKKPLLLNPLCEAVMHNEEYSFQALIQQPGIDIDGRDYNNLTPLWYAAYNGRVYMAKELLDHGADIEFRDAYGNTILLTACSACKGDDVELINLLIAYGADINAENNYGVSPKSFAKTTLDFPEVEAFKD